MAPHEDGDEIREALASLRDEADRAAGMGLKRMPDSLRGIADQLEAALTAARADNARLREALEPFLRTFAAMKVAGLTPGDTFAVHPEAPIGDVLDGTYQPRVADFLALDCAALQQEHPHG